MSAYLPSTICVLSIPGKGKADSLSIINQPIDNRTHAPHPPSIHLALLPYMSSLFHRVVPPPGQIVVPPQHDHDRECRPPKETDDRCHGEVIASVEFLTAVFSECEAQDHEQEGEETED